MDAKKLPPKLHIPEFWMGVFWKILSCACFAAINIIVRYLSGGSPVSIEQPLPIYTIIFFQNIIGATVMLLVVDKNSFKKNTNQENLKTINLLHVSRVVIAVAGVYCWYLSLRYMPLPQVVAISFIAPILTTFAAIIFLREKPELLRTLAIITSIIGGFFISRPDVALKSNLFHISWPMLLPLIGALFFAADKVITRKIVAMGEKPYKLTFYLLAFMGLACALPQFYFNWVMPNSSNMFWLIVLALIGVGAHFTFSKAYVFAEVTTLLPFGIAKILICSVVSFLVFAEVPKNSSTWIGVFVLTVSTVLLEPKLLFYIRSRISLRTRAA